MRRSFGPMGSGGGGGAMMRTVQRAVRTSSGGRGGSSHDPNYNNNNNNNNNHSDIISLSSSHHPVNYLNNEYDDRVFAIVPSMNEVHHALSFLQRVGDPSTRLLQRRDSVIFQKMVSEVTSDKSVWNAFINSEAVRKLRVSVNEALNSTSVRDAEPSDSSILQPTTSVREAFMNRKVVRELRDSVNEANCSTSVRDAEPSDSSILLSDILDWIYVNMKAQMMEVLEKTIAMVSNLFRSPRNENNATGVGDEGAANEPRNENNATGVGDEGAANEPRNENNATGGYKYAANEPFEKDLRSSFFLSVMVMMIVVLIRAFVFII